MSDKAFAESLQIEGQKKEIAELKEKVQNQTQNSQLGQNTMEKDLKEAVDMAKHIGFDEGQAQQKEYYRLANEQQSLVQQSTLSTKKSQMEILEDKEATLTKNLEASKKQLNQTLSQKSNIEAQIKDSSAKKMTLDQQIAKEEIQEKQEQEKLAQQEKARKAAEQKVKMAESIAKAKEAKNAE